MKKVWVVALVLVGCFTLNAQIKELSLKGAVLGQWSTFRPKTNQQLQWVSNENSISWVTADTANPILVKQNITSKKVTDVISLKDLQSIQEFDGLKRFPRIKWVNSNSIKINYKRTTYSINVETKKATALYIYPKESNNLDLNSSNDIAFTRGNNLFISSKGKEIQVTNDTKEGIVNGQSVHRFEFGIHKGTFWSNNGNLLAFYKKDESMVSNYPLTNFTSKPAAHTPARYPMAGMASHQVSLGIYNLNNNKTVWVNTGVKSEQYLTNVAWGPEDKFIYIAVLNRDQNHLNLNQYNAENGQFVKTILEEKHDKYVQPLHPMEFLPNDNNQFIWQSEKDGYNHIYLYNLKGKELKQLTQGEWVVTGTNGFNDEGNLFYMRTANNGMDRLLAKVNLKSAKNQNLTEESGVHTVKHSHNFEYFIDYYTSIETPLNVSVLSNEGKKVIEVSKAPNPFALHNVRLPEISSLKTNEGTTLNTRIFKPYNFDENKKYKTLLYVYNGPGVQLITNRWLAGASLWMAYLANQGYIVYTIDGRGSENRGREFEQAIFKQLGEYELVDQLSGVEYLRSLPYVDANKMAVHGWSYGGFMTTSLMLKAPGIFKVGVAGGPVIDWKYYEIMYTERYMDTPETNEAGFARASLLDKVENLQGKLLLIHGADDDVVVPQHSIDFLKHSIDKGVQVDFFLYPGHKHNVRGKDRVHLMQKVIDYIDQHIE